MSSRPTGPEIVDRSPDLRRLRDQGYDVEVSCGTLRVRGIPFVTPRRAIGMGDIVVPLRLAGGRTAAPRHHAIEFVGGRPCDRAGVELPNLERPGVRAVDEDRDSRCFVCAKPVGREFADYHELVVTHAMLIGVHAGHLDRSVLDRAGPSADDVDPDACFRYPDTATARGRTERHAKRLAGGRIGIVGLGGTGGYVLDLVAKTPVREIHLFDDDVFLTHNAFRAPGAASAAQLERQRLKVDHFADAYSRMHLGIVPHGVRIDEDGAKLLDGLDFVFVCIDDGPAKVVIMDRLEAAGIDFVDVGMGLRSTDGGIIGAVRTTSSTSSTRKEARRHIPIAASIDDVYATNVQTADLNMMNAAMAVMRWKRLRGFYAGGEGACTTVLLVESDTIVVAEKGREP